MESASMMDLARDAATTTLVLAGPLLIAALVVGVVVGMLQALTQIHDQAIAFAPKFAALAVALVVLGPWMLERLVEYTRELLLNIPKNLGG
ncbi:MAG TPA: flagellar biosynthesis protein FliQ [Pirellulales bacterium]